MTTNSALSASLRLRRLLAGAGMSAFAAVAFTGSPAGGEPREKIVFANTCVVSPECTAADAVTRGELYIMNPDGSEPIRLTNNGFGEAVPALSPGVRGKIVFDGDGTAGGTRFDSDLFLLNPAAAAGVATPPQQPLTRGSSASFDPTGANIVFHRSASDTYGTRISNFNLMGLRNEPGGPTIDSDIFLVNLEDLLEGGEPVNLTNGLTSTPGVRGVYASDDADWSPDGKWIAFTSRRCPMPSLPSCGHSSFADWELGIYVMNLETKVVTKLTNLDNLGPEERSPAWSPDSTRIAIARRLEPPIPLLPFEIWVLDFDPGTHPTEDPPRVTNQTRLTFDTAAGDLGPNWSPTGEKIVFQKSLAGINQVWVMNADGSNQHALTGTDPSAPPGALLGQNFFPKWGRIAVGHDPQ
jgi:Tol biopolymer transport system component